MCNLQKYQKKCESSKIRWNKTQQRKQIIIGNVQLKAYTKIWLVHYYFNISFENWNSSDFMEPFVIAWYIFEMIKKWKRTKTMSGEACRIK